MQEFSKKDKNIFPAQINTLYYVTRTKDIYEEQEEPMVFLFAGLTKKELQQLGTTSRKKVTPVFSKIIETPLSQIPEYAADIPAGTFTKEIGKEEFVKLVDTSQKDYKVLFKYTYE